MMYVSVDMLIAKHVCPSLHVTLQWPSFTISTNTCASVWQFWLKFLDEIFFKKRQFCLRSIDTILFLSLSVNFDHFQILRAIGKGSFGKVSHSFVRVFLVLVYLHSAASSQFWALPYIFFKHMEVVFEILPFTAIAKKNSSHLHHYLSLISSYWYVWK